MAAIESSLPFIREAINVLDISPASGPLIMADFGSAHGLNSTYAMKKIIEYLQEFNKVDGKTQLLIVHNDLPTNDWKTVFELLNRNNSYYSVASGRSFYESCLPSDSLSIGYSSNSIHWLSRKPCNISNHCIASFAQGDELKAYQEQARLDYTQFIKQRVRELKVGGVFILTNFSVNEQGLNGIENSMNVLYQCAQSLSLLTPQELLDYSIPMYNRSLNECVDLQLFHQCSLTLIKSSLVEVKTPLYKQYTNGEISLDEFARTRTQTTRTYTESPLRQALEDNGRLKEEVDNILTQFWTLYEQEVKKKPDDYKAIMYNTYLVLKKIKSEK
ncbi:unnamed protein product [Rotaria sp. Silwood1]|nr:unnamed protein product [Rotaria sp. Silwood1]CAF1427892.1 unnamed protein product [Rotaria sp. Silwood1]CAF3644969.1 unnamed protein product [Rotaria sp. Silwood1]CAF4877347.1 unnamed protein product [Rotaria sp. Silwood1]